MRMASSTAVASFAGCNLDSVVLRFLDAARRERALSPHTLAAYRTDLTALARWLAERSVPIVRATRADVEEFLARRVQAGARPTSIARQFFSARRFFNHLLQEGITSYDPTAEIPPPKIRRAPLRLLTEEQVEVLLSTPVTSEPIGQRDRIMLELLYTAGLRVSELVNLQLQHINLYKGVIRIVGRGHRERLIPLGVAPMRALNHYIGSVRGQILLERQSDFLFPTRRTDRITRQAFWLIMKRYALRAGITQELSPHTLRYTFATHLLQGGTESRVVQRLLGHSDWSTRQIHKHLMREQLKE
jgi:integrase/recombinase XerD